MKEMSFEDYCRSLSIDEILKLIVILDDIKREKKRAEIDDLLDEFKILLNKIKGKSYTLYYNGEKVDFDYIEIC